MFLRSLLVTTSKALVTSSDALVPSSLLFLLQTIAVLCGGTGGNMIPFVRSRNRNSDVHCHSRTAFPACGKLDMRPIPKSIAKRLTTFAGHSLFLITWGWSRLPVGLV